MAQWFLIRNGKEHGPVTDQQLKDLAAQWRIQPTDQIRRHDMAKPVLAGAINGLFPKVVTSPMPPPSPQPAPAEPPAEAGKEDVIGCLAFIGALMAIVVLIWGVAHHFKKSGSSGSVSTQPREDLQKVNNLEFIQASRLQGDYDGNEVAADEKYKGKIVYVEGEVVGVEKDGSAVELKLGRARVHSIQVRCKLSSASAASPDLKRVQAESWVKISGLCEGKLDRYADPVGLSDCEFLIVNE